MKPLIWIESVIEKHAHSRVEIMVKAKSQFKRRSTANNVEILIPVPNDADSPKFKTTIGNVQYNLPWCLVLIFALNCRKLQVCSRAECRLLEHQVIPRWEGISHEGTVLPTQR